MSFPQLDKEVPWLTTEQMIEVDRLMIEDFEIDLVRMMESAGRNLARVATDRLLDRNPHGRRVVVLAGTGGNGGGALVCARRLANWGADVEVYLTSGDDASFGPVPAHQLSIVRNMGIDVPGDAVRAEATMTLALPKAGLAKPNIETYVGELYLADISVPPSLYSRMGLEVPPIFGESEILRLR